MQKNVQPLSLPLSKRPVDIAIIIFFAINLFFITYVVDIEQLIITNADDFTYPLFPPKIFVDLVHWYGRTFDPVLIARPAWWRATIWIDSLFFGPFYAIAIYAYTTGKNWIRLISIVWASVMLTNVTIILFEETVGEYPSPELMRVYLANLGWIVFPLIVMIRMWRSPFPFAGKINS
ncbi:MAG: hypothetical protein JWN78_1523 [Bacteroidota bacterium]|nr:hypothetical protein [Bacteroidota bacterium]